MFSPTGNVFQDSYFPQYKGGDCVWSDFNKTNAVPNPSANLGLLACNKKVDLKHVI